MPSSSRAMITSPASSWSTSAQNVVMLRTFSKIYALAGLRLGWAYCSAAGRRRAQPRARRLQRQPAGAGRGDRRARRRRPRSIARASTTTSGGLARRASSPRWASRVNPSVGNFVLVRFPAAPQECRCRLRFPQVARHPDAQDGRLRPARASAHHHRHGGGDARRRRGDRGFPRSPHERVRSSSASRSSASA